MTAIRLPVSFVLSLLATATLFWLLAALTASAPPPGIRVPTIADIRVTHIPEDRPAPPPTPPKPVIPKPHPDENWIGPTVTKHPGPAIEIGPLAPGDPWPRGDGTRQPDDPTKIVKTGGTDHGPVPSVRIEPDYPAGAKDRGIEGWVTFRFTVATDGSVKDVEIVDAQPPHVWDSATKRAVASWKYQPAMKDGAPVEQRGMMATYRFELER